MLMTILFALSGIVLGLIIGYLIAHAFGSHSEKAS